MSKKRGEYFANSKAQVAIFIVSAFIIILLGVLYFFYQRQAVEREIEVVPPEIAPIKLYIENCMKTVAEDGMEAIGLTGGYTTIPERINSNPRAYLSTFPGSEFKTPYWWYDGIEAVPTEDFINQQLTTHIRSELKNCLNNFEPFIDRFEINELKELSINAQFNENDVTVSLNYPLEIISRDGTLKQLIQNFNYIIPIRFKRVYELAKLIMEIENKDYFLERRTIDLYSLDPEIPTTDAEASCKTKIWQLSNIKEKLQTLLRVNLPYIRIKGTDYNPHEYVPNPSGKNLYSQTYFQQHYIWEIDEKADKYKNMKVAFAYEDWPMLMHARPSENGLMRSNAQKGTDMLSFFCLQIWHFTYDVSYPVVVTLYDQESETNRAYRFSFPFWVVVDHNQPNRANVGKTLFETFPDVSSEDFCNAVTNEITIFTVNNATGEDIKEVNLTFVCGRFYCNMGQSNWLSFGAASGIIKRFPYCVNGIVRGAKEGFAESQSFIQTDVDGRSYLLGLNPIKEFKNYRVVKHMLSDPSIATEFKPNERASILIKAKNSSFESFAVYPKEAEFPLKLRDGIDSIYEVTIYLVDEENILAGYIGDWKVSKSELKDANEIVFHVVEQGTASEDERLLFLSGLSSYSKNIPAPELK